MFFSILHYNNNNNNEKTCIYLSSVNDAILIASALYIHIRCN